MKHNCGALREDRHYARDGLNIDLHVSHAPTACLYGLPVVSTVASALVDARRVKCEAAAKKVE